MIDVLWRVIRYAIRVSEPAKLVTIGVCVSTVEPEGDEWLSQQDSEVGTAVEISTRVRQGRDHNYKKDGEDRIRWKHL